MLVFLPILLPDMIFNVIIFILLLKELNYDRGSSIVNVVCQRLSLLTSLNKTVVRSPPF